MIAREANTGSGAGGIGPNVAVNIPATPRLSAS